MRGRAAGAHRRNYPIGARPAMGTAVRRGRARRRTPWPRRGWTRRACVKMLLTCRSTVRSLIVRPSRSPGWSGPPPRAGGPRPRVALRPPGRRAAMRTASASRARSECRAERSNTRRAASGSSAGAVIVAERAAGTAVRARTRAASYGASRSRQAPQARRRVASAPWTSPSASRTEPSARAAIARRSGASSDSESVARRSAAARARGRHRRRARSRRRLEQPRRDQVVGASATHAGSRRPRRRR